jgi:hypothetical protein
VVGKDPYELRLVVPAGAASWRVTGIEVAKEDETAGVQSSFTQDGPKIRVRLTSGVTREIRWRVRFEKAKVDSGAAEPVTGLSAKSDHQGVTLTWTGKADLFMVEKAGTAAMVTPTVTYNDPDVAIGKTYHYRVAALGWNGATSSVATVEILQKAPECPPEPPLPTVYLDALKPLVNKFGGVSKIAPGTSVSCGPLKVNGKVYAHGVGSHSPGLAVYAIPAGATRFVALAGLDEKVRNHPRASVVFQIYGDVLEMGEKPVLLAESPGLSVRTIGHWAFDVPLNARYRQIRLVVTDAGDGNTADHADWVDAGFIIAAGELR